MHTRGKEKRRATSSQNKRAASSERIANQELLSGRPGLTMAPKEHSHHFRRLWVGANKSLVLGGRARHLLPAAGLCYHFGITREINRYEHLSLFLTHLITSECPFLLFQRLSSMEVTSLSIHVNFLPDTAAKTLGYKLEIAGIQRACNLLACSSWGGDYSRTA